MSVLAEEHQTYTRLYQQITDRGPWMQTASGKAFFLADPRPEEVDVHDIAHALANQARYNGHTQKFYSVAQHAVLVSSWMMQDGWSPSACYAGLHHDSAEAYTGDVPSYLKHIVPEFKVVEQRVEEAVNIALGSAPEYGLAATIKNYDLLALATEKRDVLGPNNSEFTWGDMPAPRANYTIVPWPPGEAREVFMFFHDILQEILDV